MPDYSITELDISNKKITKLPKDIAKYKEWKSTQGNPKLLKRTPRI
jgi:hypothetical protein